MSKSEKVTLSLLGNQAGAVVLSLLLPFAAGASGIGYKETVGVHVPAGTSETLSGNIIEGTDGKFFKTGEGTLTVPLSQVNRQTDWNLTALSGTLTVTPGEDATVDGATPPAVLQKAKLWLDETSVVVTNGACPWYDGATVPLCEKWVDVRDKETPNAPSHIYATPAWTGYTAANYAAYVGVGPVQTNVDGRTALFFYGARGVYLRLSATITNTIQFVVHGIRSTDGVWGPVIGYTGTRSGGYLTDTGKTSMPVQYSSVSSHFAKRLDCTYCYSKSRNYLDGVLIDPFHEKPKNTFQLFENHFFGRRHQFDMVFCNKFDGNNDVTTAQGGDFVSEIIAFEDPISEAERLEVERYLMAKWNLPNAGAASALRYPEKTGLLGAASNATVIVQTDSATTPPVAFAGEGELRKTTAGRLSLGLGGAAESAGRLRINGGDVIVRSGRAPAQKAEDGSYHKAAVSNPGSTRTADVDAEAGVLLTRALGAGSGKVVKQGNDWVRFNEIAQTVKEVTVEAGTMQLESKPLTARYAEAPGGIEATVENGDFEMPFPPPDYPNGRSSLTAGGVNGWRKAGSLNAGYYVAWTNAAARTWFGEREAQSRPYGNHALLINTSGAAETTITVPQSGRYEFDCWAMNRYDPGTASFSFSYVTLYVGRDASSLAAFGQLHAAGEQFNRYRFTMPYLEAGTYVLRLVGTMNGNDGATLFDSVRVAYMGENEDEVSFTVPNGDFETLIPAANKPYYSGYALHNAIDGWTLAVTNTAFAAYKTNTLIGAVSSLLHREFAYSLYDEYNVRRGNSALALLKNGAYARTTFTAPAGHFKLRGTVVNRPLNFTPVGSKEATAGSPGKVVATLTLADSTVLNLGYVWASSVLGETAFWPNDFELAEAQQVTLEIYQTEYTGSALVDDLVFVTERRRDGKTNLIACPGAETTDWSRWKTSGDTSYWTYSGCGYQAYDNANKFYYGYCAFEGERAFTFQCAGILRQTVTIPEAGTYRFTCHSRTRADDAGYSGNGIRFWTVKSGSTVTNFHNTLLMPYCRNFIERSWLVNFPEAGEWTFGMTGTGVAGTNTNADRLSYLDGLALVRADDREDVPSVPKKMCLSVASGARMVLDYPGTVKVRRLMLGGVRKEGVVNAATDPDYIGGIGSLMVVPSGATINFR